MIGIVLLLSAPVFPAERPDTQRATLLQLSRTYHDRLEARQPQLYWDLLASDNPAQKRLNDDPDMQLMFIDERGLPAFYTVTNLNAARTISTDDVWPGGSIGLSLIGSGTSLGRLGIWDGGGVLTSHQEFGGRVANMDNPDGTHYHATHVAGTMVAGGVKSQAKGMSYQGTLAAYDWDYDESEMGTAAAAGMNVSNHSYGYVVGWRYNNDWYWYGDIGISTTEDYSFGYYDDYVRYWDEISYYAPYYLIVKSAGNDRTDSGPGAGGGHYVWDGGWVWSTDTRDEDCAPNGYDCIGWRGNAKNILTVGAVGDIMGGYSAPGDVNMASFSSWGPTDDGRIKPDLVANGISLYSCMNADDTDYGLLSGTSMSTPNASGSINLLVRHYETTHDNQTPLASTMKAVVIHTADEAGPYTGPDYMFGWGLMNTASAAQQISDDAATPGMIVEVPLTDAVSHEYLLESDGASPLRVTLVWTDPPGNPPAPSLDPTDLMLVNDLDIRLEHIASATIYQPYVLDPANPAGAATTGDNFRDNVEQIHVSSPTAGIYRITISHKGTLSATQYYSIVMSKPQACVDSDGDGFGDPDTPGNTCPDDNCPGDYNQGQEDSDSDGVGDACDGCPSDPNKIAPDECGCGIADTDSDGDGVADCNDACPGFDDNTDFDQDGVPDGCDNCSEDANPDQADHNGDQIGDVCCCVDRVGDANGVGGDEPTIGDVSMMIEALFIGGDPVVIVCLAEADVNQSGGANPAPGDITIGDISTLIEYLFIAGPMLGLPECL